MTRSTSINNAELRKMSTPIPISVNTWQMRSPHQFLNTEDSNQFDPGIMEQTGISQSSVSPSSAASYSFSPIAYINNNNNNNNTNINPNSTTTGETTNNNSDLINNINPNLNVQQHANLYINQPSQQQQPYQHQQQQQHNQHHSSNLTLNNINQPQQQHHQNQLEPTMNALNNPNNLMINQTLNQFSYDATSGYSSVDLGGHTDLFGEGDEERTYNQLIADNDLFSGTGLYEDTHASNVPLPDDLESLLINATLSDNSSQNMLIASTMSSSHTIDAQITNQHQHNQNHQDDTSDEQSVTNNINPMFLFSKTNNIQQNQHQQQQQFVNHSNNKSSSFLSQQQQPQQQYFDDQQGTIALSLPANSYLAQNFYGRPTDTSSVSPNGMNQNQQTGNYNNNSSNTNSSNSRSINQLLSNNINRKINANNSNNGSGNSYNNQNQMSDPVLTQAQLNKSKKQQQMQDNGNNNSKAQVNQFSSNSNNLSNRTSPTNGGNRKISYLLSQQNQQQQQQQQQMNMMTNNSHNFAQQQAMSLPGNSNMYYLRQHIKQEPQQPTDEDSEKFSKLKLSSPGSASTSSSSSSAASSSSSSANLQPSQRHNNNTNTSTVATDLDNFINSTGLFNNDDVMSVLSNPTSVQPNQQRQNKTESDIFFSKITSLDVCGELNLPSDDQTVVEECLKFASDLEAEGLARQQGRIRRRATVSFSKDVGEEEDEDDYEDDYEDDDYEEEEDEEEDQANTPLQFSGAGAAGVDGRPGQSMGIAINRRRSSRSFSGTGSKLSKSFSAQQQNVTKRRQMNINQLCVGSVGSSSHLYMMQQQQQRSQMNSRKHARTSALSLSTSGVDVHSQSQGVSGIVGVQQVTSSNSKDMFSNLQFAPFSANTNQQPPQQQQVYQIPQNQHIASNSQQGFLSSSLPVTTHFDSMMNNNTATAANNHPNLNKLLLNNKNQQQGVTTASNLPVFSSSFGSGATSAKLIPSASKLGRTTTKAKKLTGSLGMLQKKRGQQKKQDLFEDSDEIESDSDEDGSEDEGLAQAGRAAGTGKGKRSAQLRDCSDLDEEEDESTEEEDDDSNDALNTTRSSVTSSAHPISHSASSSFVNSESLFDLMMSSKSRDAYFWQYNVQSKGPKTKKVLTLRNKDPHLHRDFFDPVFQLQSLNARGGTAVNKLRKGDGNDVTPNPEKLYNLGNQIRDFIQKSYQMNNACFSPPPPSISSSSLNQLASTPVGSVGSTANTIGFLSSSVDTAVPKEKVNLKREKNKIASRACRLKKKAQHEANKIKLFGLNDEHKQLLDSITSARELIRTKLMEPHKFSGDKKMIDLMDDQINQKYKTKLAGNSDGYVHMLMLQVEKDRANNRKSGILDLNNLNKQYTLFQQHEKQVLQQQKLQQQQQGQQIKVEQQSYDDQVGMDESTGGFMFNENTLSPQTTLQF